MIYDDYVVLDTLVVSGGDIDMDRGHISIEGLGSVIPVNHILSVAEVDYALGVVSDKTYDLSGYTYAAGDKYSLTVKQAFSNYEKTFYYYSGDSTPTGASSVDAFVAAINADPNCPVTATDATASIQLVLDDATTGDFSVTFKRNDIVVANSEVVNTAFVKPEGTAAMVRAEVGDSSAGADAGEYQKFVVKYYDDNGVNDEQRVANEIRVVGIYVDEQATNYAAFDLDDYFLGAKTGKTYNGAKVYTNNGTIV